jgi:hypothetical protein
MNEVLQAGSLLLPQVDESEAVDNVENVKTLPVEEKLENQVILKESIVELDPPPNDTATGTESKTVDNMDSVLA